MKFPISASALFLLTLSLTGLGAASPASAAAAGPPRYYVETGVNPRGAANFQGVVRARATGAITGTVRCPWRKSEVGRVAAASHQIFFIDCVKTANDINSTVLGSRIFRFHVTAAGRTDGYSRVPGGNFKTEPLSISASANGADLALDVPTKAGRFQIIVINVKTGAHAVWRNGVASTGEFFDGWEPSLTANGKKLAVFGQAFCPKGSKPGTCKSPGQEMRLVSPAMAGGTLASGRRVFKESQLTNPSNGIIYDAFINAAGTAVTAGTVFGTANGSNFVEVLSVSAATGQRRRVEFKLNTSKAGFSYIFVRPDQSGRWVIFDAGPPSHLINAWVDHGKFTRLKPIGALVNSEAWSS
ncbi:MAG TPA: hypothetical protein VFI65_22940 [Streptosporangiaceae bacterium]|nr:hypothetical protein [Streptosporangiaceae bacterium]